MGNDTALPVLIYCKNRPSALTERWSAINERLSTGDYNGDTNPHMIMKTRWNTFWWQSRLSHNLFRWLWRLSNDTSHDNYDSIWALLRWCCPIIAMMMMTPAATWPFLNDSPPNVTMITTSETTTKASFIQKCSRTGDDDGNNLRRQITGHFAMIPELQIHRMRRWPPRRQRGWALSNVAFYRRITMPTTLMTHAREKR